MVNQDPFSYNQIKSFVEIHYKELIIAVCCLAAAGIGFYIFMYSRAYKQERAQLAFAQTIAEFKHGEKNAESWTNAELAAKTGYRSYKNSSLAPYFLVLESQAAIRQGNTKEALKTLQEAITAMGKSSPLYYAYRIKAARLKLDSDDLAVQTEGFKELQLLAEDASNKQRDEALYYLGDYYLVHNDINRGKEVWKKLIAEFPQTEDFAMSPWALLALDKSKQIS